MMDNVQSPMFVVLRNPFAVTVPEIIPEFVEKADKWNQLKQPRYSHAESCDTFARILGVLSNKPISELFLATITLYPVVYNEPDNRRYLLYAGRYYMDYLARSLPEFAREMVLRQLKSKSKSDLGNEGKRYLELVKEDENTHIADIFGLILEELMKSRELSDAEMETLMGELGDLLLCWRNLKVPKTENAESYEIIKQISTICFLHGAYHTCLLLVPLHLICDKNCYKHFEESLYFAGKVLFELGYKEIAKNCFQRVDEATSSRCWKEEDKKYRDLLEEETGFTIPVWMKNRDEEMQRMIQSGEVPLLPFSEIKGLMNLNDKEISKANARLKKVLKEHGEKILSEVAKAEKLVGKERHETARKLLEVLEECGSNTREAVLCYCLDGEAYLQEEDLVKAAEVFGKAYGIDEGRYSERLMNGFALLAEKQGKLGLAKTYSFRANILKV